MAEMVICQFDGGATISVVYDEGDFSITAVRGTNPSGRVVTFDVYRTVNENVKWSATLAPGATRSVNVPKQASAKLALDPETGTLSWKNSGLSFRATN